RALAPAQACKYEGSIAVDQCTACCFTPCALPDGIEGRSTRQPLTASVSPTTSRPPLNSPVEFLSRPMMYGPKKPPRFPRELMNAIPTGASRVPSAVVGMAQKGPTMAKTPSMAMLSDVIAVNTEVEYAAQKRASAPVMAAVATWPR